MKISDICAWALLCVLIISACRQASEGPSFEAVQIDYPETRLDSTVTETYHDTLIADPFRWLENDHSEETGDWVDRQNAATFDYMAHIPYRDKIRERLEKLWNYAKYGSPFKEGEAFYFFKNDGLQNQSVMYRIEDLEGTAEAVLDPNKFSNDGTASLGTYGFSSDGRYLAYQISEGGSDWRTARVLDLDNDEMLDDAIEWIKFSGLNWYKDGFFYSRYPAPEDGSKLSAKNEYHSVYYHRLGTEQSDDELIFRDDAHPQRNAYASTTDDERFLVLQIVESTSGNALSVKDLEAQSDFVSIVESFDHDFTVIDNEGDELLVLTNYGAPNQRLIAVNVRQPGEAAWKDIIPESEDALRNVSVIGGKLFAEYLHNASSLLKTYAMDGTFLGDAPLPGIGTVSQLRGSRDESVAFYTFASFTVPATVYQLDATNLQSTVFRQPEVDFRAADYVTKQVWYESYDGTRIPMFVTHRKDVQLDGSNPTLLYGYGGFDIAILPRFDIRRLPILESGGIYAVANIRGGGEFGKKWHQAGTLSEKQNVFDDFQSAAEFLIREKYTSSDKLAIEGRSNGGLLVGACMTQRPDLYRVAFPIVGVLDMLRYHTFTIGWAWATDYGRSDDPAAFDYLIKYSPLHNVRPADYPATLVLTADHDDRVVPAHSFKFISELQRRHTGEDPVLIRIDKSAGHGAGKPTSKLIDETADMLSFMFYNMEEPVEFDVEG